MLEFLTMPYLRILNSYYKFMLKGVKMYWEKQDKNEHNGPQGL